MLVRIIGINKNFSPLTLASVKVSKNLQELKKTFSRKTELCKKSNMIMSRDIIDQLNILQDVTTTKYVIEQIKRVDQDLWARKVLEHFTLHWCWRSPTFILKTSLLQSPSILCDNDIGLGAQTHNVCNILTSTGGWWVSVAVESSMSRWNYWRELILPPTLGWTKLIQL